MNDSTIIWFKYHRNLHHYVSASFIYKTFSYDFPKLHHSNPNSFGANVYLRQLKKNG